MKRGNGTPEHPIVIEMEEGESLTDAFFKKGKKSKKKPEAIAAVIPDRKPIEITGAALKDNFCNYSYDHTVAKNTTNNVNIKSAVIYHADLGLAFNKLNVHLAVICEELAYQEIPDIDNLPLVDEDHPYDSLTLSEQELFDVVDKFKVSAFRIDASGENEGVILIGQKTLSTAKTVKLETPKTLWTDSYHYSQELRIAVDNLKDEVEQYMKGKQAPQFVQQELELES